MESTLIKNARTYGVVEPTSLVKNNRYYVFVPGINVWATGTYLRNQQGKCIFYVQPASKAAQEVGLDLKDVSTCVLFKESQSVAREQPKRPLAAQDSYFLHSRNIQ